jgi:hypothetical protein
LDDFQIAYLNQQFLDLSDIGGILASILHVPAVVFSIQRQIGVALDVDDGDVIDLIIAKEFLADLRFRLGPGLLVALDQEQTRPADDGQGHY